jgi:CelD/BcsL family acetyltransferase involved in cellulose biosynthesis
MSIAAEPATGHQFSRFSPLSYKDGGALSEGLRVGREDGFDFCGQEYLRLFEASAATAFQHPAWLRHFYEALAPRRGAEKVVVALRDSRGGLAGILPLILRRKAGMRLLETTDLGVSDYAAAPVDEAIRGAVVAHPDLKRQIAAVLPAHDILRIRPIRAEHVGDWQALLEGNAEPLDFGAPFAPLGTDYAEWRRTRPSKSLLGRLARADKRNAKLGGARLVRLASPAEIRGAVAEIQRLRAGRFAGDLIQEDFVRDFYAAVAADGASPAEVFRLDIGDAPAGYVYGLGHRGRFYYLLIGCDYAGHGRSSPGLVLYDRIIADWMERGGDVFDFTIGDEPFKADFGTETTPMFTIVNAPTWRGKLALAAFRAHAQLRAPKTEKPSADDA